MRLSSSVIFQQQQSSIQSTYSSYASSLTQVSSGLRVSKPSDDPIAASQSVLVSQAQSASEKYSTSRSSAESSLEIEDSVLDEITNIISKVQSLIVKAANTTYTDEDRESMATELQSYKEQLVTLGNSTDGSGNYIFGGYSTDTAPFTMDDDGTVTYNGSSTAISVSISANRSITVGDTGSDLFGENGSNIFDTIDKALSAMSTSLDNTDSDAVEEYSNTMGEVMSTLSDQYDDVLKVQSALGGKLNEIDSLESLSTDLDLVYSDRQSELVDADYTEAISNYTMQKVALQATYQAMSVMSSLSLFSMNA